MEIPVLIEPVKGGEYRAATLAVSAEWATKEETLRNFKSALVHLLMSDPEFATIKFPPIGPWAKSFRNWDPNDPAIVEWLRHVEDFRRQRNEELDRK